MNKELIKDLARKRRAYLWKKTFETSLMISGFFTMTGATFAAYYLTVYPTQGRQPIAGPWGTLCLFIFAVTVGVFSLRLLARSEKNIKAIPYVPSVADQIAGLPPAEILVRGSDHPTASVAELSRAAHKGTDTAAEELLRPKSDPTPEELQQIKAG